MIFSTIAKHLEQVLNNSTETNFIINNQQFKFAPHKFELLNQQAPPPSTEPRAPITFIDAGSAVIASASTFSISIIRVIAVTFHTLTKREQQQHEFYLLTTPKYTNTIHYESKLFFIPPSSTNTLNINEEHLTIAWNDPTIKNGISNAEPKKIVDIARRFAELTLASLQPPKNIIILDGSLEKNYKNEEIYLNRLTQNTCAIAKSSNLLTTTGNSPNYILLKNGPDKPWIYSLTSTLHFVKLHAHSKHVLRFEGQKEQAKELLSHAADAIFPGYPYGLIYTDRIARISNEEKKTLMLRFQTDKSTSKIRELLHTKDAHNILDTIS